MCGRIMEYFCEIYLFKSYSGFYVLSLVDTSYVTSTPPNNILSSVQSNLLRLFGACLWISIELVASIRSRLVTIEGLSFAKRVSTNTEHLSTNKAKSSTNKLALGSTNVVTYTNNRWSNRTEHKPSRKK